jgi:hypothetical protein
MVCWCALCFRRWWCPVCNSMSGAEGAARLPACGATWAASQRKKPPRKRGPSQLWVTHTSASTLNEDVERFVTRDHACSAIDPKVTVSIARVRTLQGSPTICRMPLPARRNRSHARSHHKGRAPYEPDGDRNEGRHFDLGRRGGNGVRLPGTAPAIVPWAARTARGRFPAGPWARRIAGPALGRPDPQCRRLVRRRRGASRRGRGSDRGGLQDRLWGGRIAPCDTGRSILAFGPGPKLIGAG